MSTVSERSGHGRPVPGDRLRAPGVMWAASRACGVGATNGRAAGEHLVRQRTHGVDVGAMIHVGIAAACSGAMYGRSPQCHSRVRSARTCRWTR
jgi:hypothetical protein